MSHTWEDLCDSQDFNHGQKFIELEQYDVEKDRADHFRDELAKATLKLEKAEKALGKIRCIAHGCCICDTSWSAAENYFNPDEDIEKELYGTPIG